MVETALNMIKCWDDLRTKRMGKSTRMASPTKYGYEIQLCFFRGLASSGQLGMRLTVVPHVFELAVTGAGNGSGECSSTCSRGRFSRSLEKSAIVDHARSGRIEAGERQALRLVLLAR